MFWFEKKRDGGEFYCIIVPMKSCPMHWQENKKTQKKERRLAFFMDLIYTEQNRMGQTRKAKRVPKENPATLREGTIQGNWVVKKGAWVERTKMVGNGFKLFTVEDAAKHIHKPIALYCREYKDTWPSKQAWTRKKDSTHLRMTFVPSGNAVDGTIVRKDWLMTRKPSIRRKTPFYLEGSVSMREGGKNTYLMDKVPVSSTDGQTVSVNLMNTETFIKA